MTADVGLHLRVISELAKRARQFNADITVASTDVRANGKSVLELMSLGAGKGTVLSAGATGLDALGAVKAVTELLITSVAQPMGESEQACA